MPELPEVETIKCGLNQLILNQKIKKIDIFCEKSFIGEKKDIEGAKITKIYRKGKAILIELDNKKTLMIHLRMTGQLIYDEEGKNESERFAAGHPSENFVATLPNKQTRVVIELQNGKLFFNDQRKFGFIKVIETSKVGEDQFLKKLAKEPWEMTASELYEKCQKRKKSPIKAVILDQKVIAGLGNIYADESLFYAKIHPAEKASNLSKKEVAALLEGAKTTMQDSIEAGGSTIRNYVKTDGTRGDYLDKFAKVFNRTGKKCMRCGSIIEKTRIAGRGTHFCPNCQKLKMEGDYND